MSYHLQMNGTSDYLQLPSMTFTDIQLDVAYTFNSAGTSSYQYYLDGRTGVSNGYFARSSNPSDNDVIGSGWNSVYLNGVAQTSNTKFMTSGTRVTVKLSRTTAGTDDVTVFSINTPTAGAYTGGSIYDLKVYNGATLVAHYDFTIQSSGSTVPDQTGNGYTATVTGGTWINDGGTATTFAGSGTTDASASLTTTDALIVSGSGTTTGSSSVSGGDKMVMVGSGSTTGVGSSSSSETLVKVVITVWSGGGVTNATTSVRSSELMTMKASGETDAYGSAVYYMPPGWRQAPITKFGGRILNYTGSFDLLIFNATESQSMTVTVTPDSNGYFTVNLPQEELRVMVMINGKIYFDQRVWSYDYDVSMPTFVYR